LRWRYGIHSRRACPGFPGDHQRPGDRSKRTSGRQRHGQGDPGDTNEIKEVKTTSEGRYTIPYLTPAIYNIEVTASGFQTLKREKITLSIADKLNLPLQLTVGAVSETVVVTASRRR